MTNLVVCLGTGKGTWAHLAKLISVQQWDKVFLVTTEYFSGKFPVKFPHEFVVLDTGRPLKELVAELAKSLNGKIADTEVALNLVSGTGKEHMAILSALLKLGLGIRLVAFTGQQVEEL